MLNFSVWKISYLAHPQELRQFIDSRLNETKNWVKCDPSSLNGVSLHWQKSDDIYPLRYWRGKIDVPRASPFDVLNFILSGRRVWDLDLIEFNRIAEIDAETAMG